MVQMLLKVYQIVVFSFNELSVNFATFQNVERNLCDMQMDLLWLCRWGILQCNMRTPVFGFDTYNPNTGVNGGPGWTRTNVGTTVAFTVRCHCR